MTDHSLDYPFDDTPKDTKVINVADGIIWARMPLPWSLDHINVYLFDEGDSWTLVDTGSQGQSGKDLWDKLEETVLSGKPILRVISTHMHPDHVGLAGWLCKKYDAEFFMTFGEYMTAQKLWLEAADEVPQEQLDFMFAAGVDPAFGEMIKQAGYGHYKKGVAELPFSFNRLQDGSEIEFGGRRWRVIIGRGHSPEHACLQCLDEKIFISGDQVLPHITSNVSVFANAPTENPLALWIASLDRISALGDDYLVLPSHGRVFKGLKTRNDEVIASHAGKLKSLHEWCEGEHRSVVQCLPSLFRRKLTGMDFFLAMGEALAHIHFLEGLGLMKRSQDGIVNMFESVGEFDEETLISKTNSLPGNALRPLADFE